MVKIFNIEITCNVDPFFATMLAFIITQHSSKKYITTHYLFQELKAVINVKNYPNISIEQFNEGEKVIATNFYT